LGPASQFNVQLVTTVCTPSVNGSKPSNAKTKEPGKAAVTVAGRTSSGCA
jgi:hypothetical protein